MACPRCQTELEARFVAGGRFLRCPNCEGVAVTVEMLRRFAPKERVAQIWRQAIEEHRAGDLRCPGCEGPLRRAEFDHSGTTVRLDACTHCHVIWFDANELAEFSPEASAPAPPSPGRAPAVPPHGRTTLVPSGQDEIWRVVATLERLFS